MAVQKVEFDGRTLIDLTQDTVAPLNLLVGNTAHDKDGNIINGQLQLVIATDSTTLRATSSELSFSNLSKHPDMWAVYISDRVQIGKNTQGIVSVSHDGTNTYAQYTTVSGNTVTINQDTSFTDSYSGGVLYISPTSNAGQFIAGTYKIIAAYLNN